MQRTYIIAEAGVNHNGSLVLAKGLIDAAKESGADAVKFQIFQAETLVTQEAPLADYQKDNIQQQFSQYQMLKNLELTTEDFRALKNYAEEKELDFLSTPFDLASLIFLDQVLQLDTIKLSSGEITNAQMLLEAARTGRNIILSTGMATLGEIEKALSVLAFGLLQCSENPNMQAFQKQYNKPEAQQILQQKVTLMHCTTDYPVQENEVNLRAMLTLRQAFQLPIGFSDHTADDTAAITAVSLGAVSLEKHLTLDKNMNGPDHKASLNPEELKAMIKKIRQTEQLLGDGRKVPMPAEQKNRFIVRKSLVTQKKITKGELWQSENITTKRPGDGISAIHYWDYLGEKAKQNYLSGEQVK